MKERVDFTSDPSLLEEALREMARDAPPAGLEARILEGIAAIPAPRRSIWSRFAMAFQTPAATWAYRLAALILLGAILVNLRDLVALRTPPDVPEGPESLASLVPPTAATCPSDGCGFLVTFQFRADEAASVSVAGTFNDWDPARAPMVRGENGEWRLQLILPPGKYEYQYVIDGRRFVPDPEALERQSDGYGGENAVLRLKRCSSV
ncbi:MAG: isoamylase early set domain-containing protein [Acidobacteriota bacterium]